MKEIIRHITWRANNLRHYVRQRRKGEWTCLDFEVSVEEEVSKMLEALGER
jgi:hypothetical protein